MSPPLTLREIAWLIDLAIEGNYIHERAELIRARNGTKEHRK
jgi:hypothetical protein